MILGDEARERRRRRRSDWWHWLRRWSTTPDGRAVAVLVAIPLVVFVVPALAGYPAITGDNLIQNFPLRALSGTMLRHGQLPLWNSGIWSGSPLLGGLNAGSLYPGTFAFAVLPAVAAWVLNVLCVYWAGALGLYALLRQFALSPLASVLAAATYAFSGAMLGQLVHLPIVQGMGWIPLVILAQIRLSWAVMGTGPVGAARSDATARSAPWRWVALLGATIGLILLTGEPRSIAEAEIVCAVVLGWQVLRPFGGAVTLGARVRYLGWSALGALWGLALSAAQLLPGWSFIQASQRASETYSFFGTGSLHPQWSALLLVPDLFGGAGLLHQPVYFNSYNLPEVTGYVGLLPLVALFTLAIASVGRRRDPRSGDWGLWMLFVGLGLLLTWGPYTPLGHLFWHIPLFGKTRLQSRNLGIVDLGLAALLGYWVDGVVRRSTAAPARGADPNMASVAWWQSAGWRRWVSAAPALAAVACCVVAIAFPGPLQSAFNEGGSGSGLQGRHLTPWLLAQLVVALAVSAVALGWPRRAAARLGPSSPRFGKVLCAVVVVDLLLFSLSSNTALFAGTPVFEPTTAQAAAVLGTNGRFAIYDTTALNTNVLSQIGQPDLNAFTGLPSVQGYGSIVDNTYGSATGAHLLDTFDPCALARGVFTPLRLNTLLTLSRFLAPQVPPGQSEGPQAPVVGASSDSCPGAPAPGTPQRRTLYLGQALGITSATIVTSGDVAPQVGVMGPSGTTVYPEASVTRGKRGWDVDFAHAQVAVGIVVRGASARIADSSSVLSASGARYDFLGVLQDALGQSGWRYDGIWEMYARFERTALRPQVWLGGSSPAGQVRVVSQGDNGTAVVRVSSPTPVTVVRSEAYQQGWHAQAVAVGAGRAPVALPVHPDGLIQAVRVPAGTYLVTFRYRPKGLTLGLIASGVGVAAFGVLGAVAWSRRRSRARG